MIRRSPRQPSLLLLAPLGLVALISACAELSGSASMRVEVDVYKGPLSRDFFIQAGELKGLMEEFSFSLRQFREGVVRVALHHKACKDESCSTWWCTPQYESGKGETKKLKSSRHIVKTQNPVNTKNPEQTKDIEKPRTPSLKKTLECGILKQIYVGAKEIDDAVKDTWETIRGRDEFIETVKIKKRRDQLLNQIGVLNIRAKARALFWTESLVTTGVAARPVRATVIAFSNLLSEYGNQLGANADALAKRAYVYDLLTEHDKRKSKVNPVAKHINPGQDANEAKKTVAALQSANRLSTSVFLRDTSPTDFVNLYTWNRAGTPEPLENVILHPIESFSSESTANRVRGVERVFSDQYWTHINTVYASGQGDVNMALVRDDLGNWNLKSFSSDPGELLQAYHKLFEATTNTVVKLIKNNVNPTAGLIHQLGAMAGGALVSGQQANIPLASIEQLDQVMRERLDILSREAQRVDRSSEDATELRQNRKKLIDEVQRGLRRHQRVLERLIEQKPAENKKQKNLLDAVQQTTQ